MEIGSLTDWIIAFANIIMAVAAAYAALNAKYWIKTKINEMSFNKAIEIMVDFDNLKKKINELHFELITLGTKIDHDSIALVRVKAKDLAFNHTSPFNKSITNTTRYGFEMHMEIKDKIRCACSDYTNEAQHYLRTCETYLSAGVSIVPMIESDKINNLYEKVNDASRNLEGDITKIFTFNKNL